HLHPRLSSSSPPSPSPQQPLAPTAAPPIAQWPCAVGWFCEAMAMARRQHITIFTTASLPWMTGTAVNPLFRAAYLAKAGDWEVTLVVPWLSKGDQMLVYPNKMKFSGPAEQEGYVWRWLEERTGPLPRFNIIFYPGK
uniref:Digalactosyldiacylglycerol synthase n=1 Tax=Aegilops tauschii subsp. strangulata TaxID=200361 RepID=A0A453IEW9_AEGTS